MQAAKFSEKLPNRACIYKCLVDNADKLIGRGVQRTKNIQPISACRGFDEYPGETPKHAKERRKDKVGSIYKVQFPFPCLRFRKPWF